MTASDRLNNFAAWLIITQSLEESPKLFQWITEAWVKYKGEETYKTDLSINGELHSELFSEEAKCYVLRKYYFGRTAIINELITNKDRIIADIKYRLNPPKYHTDYDFI